jgi:hypothetical protein
MVIADECTDCFPTCIGNFRATAGNEKETPHSTMMDFEASASVASQTKTQLLASSFI